MIKKLIKPFVTRPAVARWLCRGILRADNFLDRSLNELLMYTEGGVHPKHRLMNYHQFFIDNVAANDRVLDVGCGRGSVAYDVAQKAKEVVGIELEPKNIDHARRLYKRDNLSFIVGDALKEIPTGKFDVVVLSNVLEHIEQRVDFMRSVLRLVPKALVRVPMITRDWKVLYKKEAGVDYRLDETHFIEYTEEEFRNEMKEASAAIYSLQICFGEIWSVVQTESSVR